MIKPRLEQIKNEMNRLGYVIFDGIDEKGNKKNYDLNIFGVRSASANKDSFDDWMGVFWFNWEENKWDFHVWEASTDPGTFYLKNPCNAMGTAILVEGQYRSTYKIGKHSIYKALVQIKKVRVYRDNNKDEIIDFLPQSIQTGTFGINIHRANATRTSKIVGKWSAGCQVIANPKNFATLMNLCQISSNLWGPAFTYTLIEGCKLNSR